MRNASSCTGTTSSVGFCCPSCCYQYENAFSALLPRKLYGGTKQSKLEKCFHSLIVGRHFQCPHLKWCLTSSCLEHQKRTFGKANALLLLSLIVIRGKFCFLLCPCFCQSGKGEPSPGYWLYLGLLWENPYRALACFTTLPGTILDSLLPAKNEIVPYIPEILCIFFLLSLFFCFFCTSWGPIGLELLI